MLQLSVIRQNPGLIKERLAIKNFKQPELVDTIITLDDEKRKLLLESESIQSKANSISKEIGQLMAKGQKEEATAKKQEAELLNTSIKPIKEKLIAIDKQLEDVLLKLPNLPSDKVPPGKTPEDNVEVKRNGNIPVLHPGAVPHWDLAKKYDLIDFDLGNKISGSGFPVYKNMGARLQRAMIQYFLDYNINHGYTEYQVPHMVNEASAYGTGQLPDKEGQMYFVGEDNLYLIPTSEVPLTNLYRDVMLSETELPVKMTGYTPCFRREAGSYGKDVRGLNRLHQFDKVEIVQIVHPDKSYDVLEEMVAHVEGLVKSLGLTYRILKLCGGDMGFGSALTYDFEVYSAAQERWLEVSSVSNVETFQSNRAKIRFKDRSGKTQLLHSLNGSSLALPRILAALLENNQTETGINIPEVLQPYFGKATI